MERMMRHASGGKGLLIFLFLLTAFFAAEAAADEAPSLAYDSRNNRHLLVFVKRDIGLTPHVYGQLLRCDGTAYGSAFVLSQGDSEKRAPSVAYDTASGRFIVVWEGGPSDAGNIYGQLVRADGSLQGTNFPISTADGAQSRPKVAYESANGRFFVVWADDRSGWSFDIYGQLVNADGTLYGSNFPVSDASSDQRNPSVVYDSVSRKYLVVWADDRSGSSDIYGRLVNVDGTPSGTDIVISSAESNQEDPSVAYDSVSGRFLVVWADDRSGSSSDIYGRLVLSDGNFYSPEFLISDATDNQENPAAAYDSVERRFLVAWEDNRSGSSSDIYGQYVNLGGSLSGSAFIISDAPYDQVTPVVSYNSRSANFLVAHTARMEGDVEISSIGLTLVGPACQEEIQNGGGGGGSGCFIATAAFGSHLDPRVRALRSFRDHYLLTNTLGRALVGLYNRMSPSIASYISRHEPAKTATRWILTPIVYALEYPGKALLLLLGVIIVPFAVRRLQNVRSVWRSGA